MGTPLSSPVDPSLDKTYEFIFGMINDLTSLFPDAHIHLGGDEIQQSCFDENPGIQ